jgi:Flp pilus assembly protein TadD
LNEREAGVLKLLERFPHNTNLLADQIDAEIIKGRINRVVELLAQAPTDAETDNRFWRFKGWVHYARQEFAEAEAAYRHALQLHPMDWQSLSRLLEVLRSREETTERKKIEDLIARLQELRARIRSLETLENCPLDLLRALGQLARDCGDTFIADALERRLEPAVGVRP